MSKTIQLFSNIFLFRSGKFRQIFASGMRLFFAITFVATLYSQMIPKQVALAATTRIIEVDDIDDNNPEAGCTLREAIDVVNAGLNGTVANGCTVIEDGTGTPITYEINLPSYTYTLSGASGDDLNASGDLDIIASVNINGLGQDQTIIDGGGTDRIFHIPIAELGLTINISNVTVQNGQSPASESGGGIYNNGGTFNITNSSISNNRGTSISGFGSDGGGIYTKGGTVTINNSSISNNFAEGAGNGIFSNNSQITITNSTISNNFPSWWSAIEIYYNEINIINSIIADNSGRGIRAQNATLNILQSAIQNNGNGGISTQWSTLNVANSTISENSTEENGGGIKASGTTNLTNVTVAYNIADNDYNDIGDGGGICQMGGTFNIKNSIVAGNIDRSGGGDDCFGSFLSHGYNLIGINSGCVASFPGGNPNTNNDFVGTAVLPFDPLLDDTTGNPPYYLLQLNSPAMDQIPTEQCTFISSGTNPLFTDSAPVTTDQPGTVRDTTCDIGAFEVPLVGIQVLDGGADIPDDSGEVPFGSTAVDKPVTKIFNIKNTGKETSLNLSNLVVPSGFSIANNFGTAIVTPGGQTTFEIKLDATHVETFSGQVSFNNNVVNRNPFNFTVTGTVYDPFEQFLPVVLR